MTFAIRPAQRADIAAMHDIRCAVTENVLTDPSRVTVGSYLPYVDAGTAFVAVIQGDVIGFAVLDLWSCSVWALFVRPDRAGHGIGRALLDTVVTAARDRSIAVLWLTTDRGSRAGHLYRRAGWTMTAHNGAEDRWEMDLGDGKRR